MAGYANAGLNAAVNGIAAGATWISFHTADPGTTGTTEVAGGSYARQATVWATSLTGSRVGSQTSTSIPASTQVTYWGLWTSLAGGVFFYGGALTAAETFGSAGTLQFTPTITVSN